MTLDTKFLLDFCGNESTEFNNEVVQDLETVDQIDEQIKSLVSQRNYVLYGLNAKCLAHNTVKQYLNCNPQDVLNEYKVHGFSSDTVKLAVSSLRCLFFNDADEKFQKFYCTQIINDEFGSHSDYIDFIFEDDDEHSMKLVFDVTRYEHKHLYENKLLNGYIYFDVKVGRDYCTIDRSFGIFKIRKSIESWIDNGFIAEKYKFEHETLQESIDEIFNGFKSMRT